MTAVSLLVAIATVVMVFTLVQRHWEAVTTLMLRQDVEELSVGGGKPYRVPEYRLETLLDTLKLPSSLRAAADNAGVDAAPTALAGAVDVSVARNSDVINLKVLWNDATAAARLANALAEVFVERTLQIRVEEAQEDLGRYLTQLEEARIRVQKADAAVLSFQQEHEVSDFNEETKARLIELSRLESEYRTVVAEVEGLVTARAELQVAIGVQPETVVNSTLYRNPLRKRLEEYRWQLKEARSRYTSNNPKVVKLEREITALELVLDESGEQTAPERTDGPNGLRQDMQLHMHALNDEIRKTEGRASGLALSIQENRDKLSYLSAREKEYAALKATQDAARQLESSLAAKAEEARVAAFSGEAAFHVLEPAAVPANPAPSGRKLMVAAGMILGLSLGLGLALLLEVLDPRIRDRRDAVTLVDEGVAEAFPAICRIRPHLQMDKHAQRWRRLVNDLEADKALTSLAVVSLTDREPRSVTAWNIAATFASKGLETVLASDGPCVDHEGDGNKRFERNILPTHIPRLGHVLLGDSDGASNVGDTDWIEELTCVAPRTVVDVPSLADDETAFELAAAVGSVVIVTTSGITDRGTAEQLVSRLRSLGVEIRGAIVTDLPRGRFDGFTPISAIASTLASPFRRRTDTPVEVQHA
ncbi:MAG: hypothetical protein JSW21_01630 [Gammaproteobacteria bacterium]|nr:MAG: hypothetical protein JSW21_01630 [Gammaproteobacteria bacterium]